MKVKNVTYYIILACTLISYTFLIIPNKNTSSSPNTYNITSDNEDDDYRSQGNNY